MTVEHVQKQLDVIATSGLCGAWSIAKADQRYQATSIEIRLKSGEIVEIGVAESPFFRSDDLGSVSKLVFR
jgi:positive regulator of sigma E activity